MSTRLLAIAASYREASLNKALLDVAVSLAKKEGASVTQLDYASLEAPLYRGEENVTQLPPSIETLSKAIESHDGILLATPEYNWSIPGGLKNILDWLSVDVRTPLTGKTALLMCASPAARGGATGLSHVRTSFESLGCWLYPQMITIGRAQEQLRPTGLAREGDQQHLQFCVSDFIRATKALADA